MISSEFAIMLSLFVSPNLERKLECLVMSHWLSLQVRVMDLRFSDSKGFNYLSFLGELQPSQRLEDKYHTRMGQLTAMKQQVSSTSTQPLTI